MAKYTRGKYLSEQEQAQRVGFDFDTRYAVATWWKGLRESTNEAFLPLLFDRKRYLVLMGGAGSGKSIFAGRKLLERATSERGHRFLVCRKVARTVRESCFSQLCGQLAEHYSHVKWSVNKSDLRIEIDATGSEIIFSGLDDVEKLKSIYDITGIWVEEASELEEDDFNQLDIRLRGKTVEYQQMVLTFNPVSVTHWLKARFFDSPAENVTAHRSNYKDNRFLPEENIRVLEAFRETDPYYYQVYCLGEWGVTGKTVFIAENIYAQLAKNIQPVAVGMFRYMYDGLAITAPRFSNEAGGYIKIYEEPKPGVPYVIGGDTAGDGSDSFVGQVIDNTNGRQVAILRHKTDEDMYARQMYCLGLYYNRALIGIETNFSTHPVAELKRLNYPKQYVRVGEDDYRERPQHSYGVRTGHNRNAMVAGLVAYARDCPDGIVDRTTLLEMQTFVRNENFKATAAAGAHDDCVMALAIAHYIRGQQSNRASGDTPQPRVKWTPDMHEDYRNATEEEREMLLAKWGNPF
jgi:phage terminase large subunit